MGSFNQGVGVPVERIKRMGEDDNHGPVVLLGPCGHAWMSNFGCSDKQEEFHWHNSDADLDDDSRFIEFYNLVFMQYNKMDDGSLEPLKQKNIDTGLQVTYPTSLEADSE
ncbi:hypothetical protein IFM89_021776 [Coptis chinensis]|uniref:Alanyl-tRNA synthetase class IIc N-terminal domain-containing protein n=1 Tax=Coptis chinensis TaxID=261450 RepID=A0A835M9K5_9MAGN|nr:hypothetical protein IFM89_021776 [Coptis chinensis]